MAGGLKQRFRKARVLITRLPTPLTISTGLTDRNKQPEGVAKLLSQKPKPPELVKEELRGQSPSWQKSRDRRT